MLDEILSSNKNLKKGGHQEMMIYQQNLSKLGKSQYLFIPQIIHENKKSALR
jgi:hypothetical protein